MKLKDSTTENLTNNCTSNPDFQRNFVGPSTLLRHNNFDYLLGPEFQENCTMKDIFAAFQVSFPACSNSKPSIKTTEIFLVII